MVLLRGGVLSCINICILHDDKWILQPADRYRLRHFWRAMSCDRSRATLTAGTLPADLLLRIMATACCDQPAKLLVCASVSHEFRAIAGSALHPAVNEIWGELMGGVDPAAKLRLHHARLAQSSGSWFKLAAALGARCCVECEMPTCWVAIDFDHDNLAAVRCCRECRPQYGAIGNAAGESLPEHGEALHEEEQVDCGTHSQFSSEAGSSHLDYIAVLNSMLFAGADPTVVVDFDAFDGHLDGAKALTEAICNAADGDTIGVRGSLAVETMALGDPFDWESGPAVRLLGMPASMPWTFLHGTSDDPDAELARAKLRKAEEEAAAVLGFPAAHIHVESNCLELYDPIWLESVRITTGNREHGGRTRFWESMETWRDHKEESFFAEGHVEEEALERFGYHSAIALFESDRSFKDDMALVMRKVWLTSYWGSCVVFQEGANCAMLQCCISNSLMVSVVCSPGSSLRLRGCHIICNSTNGDDTTADKFAEIVPEAQMRALQSSNVFFDNGDGIYQTTSTANDLHDAFMFPDGNQRPSARIFI